MRNKSFKRMGAVLMAAVLMMSNFGGMSAVQAEEVVTQMSSDKEVVYVNAYGGEAREQNFDSNWKFYLGDASGAETAGYDDSGWRTVSLPHDYSIEQEYTRSGEAESAYLPGGTGWYRKHFTLGSELEGKELRIDFGGVYMNATVWVNGTQLGTHPYGYTPFSFDITDYVTFNGENVITVKVDHKTPSSRWYSGSGIYRSVNLTVMDKVHVDLYGTQITTPNLEKEHGGTVNMTVKTTVANESTEAKNVVLVHTIYEKGTENSIGTVTTAAQSVAAGETADISATLPAANPKLWDMDNPNLYTVVTEVKVGADVVDTYETEYGFRYFSFDNNTGFKLNGENVKLKGVCMHHDQGSLGAEAHARATERQVEILKEMGCNSIRVTHNPASDELIEACNELGILVIEEAFDGWIEVKNGNTYDYSNHFEDEIGSDNEILHAEADMTWAEFDIKAMVERGVNAPSIIMWSLGNEVQEGTYWTRINEYPQVAANLIEWVQEIDESRPVTNGDNVLKGLNTAAMLSVDTNIYNAGGVVGANYASGSNYDSIHSRYPNWPIYGSETASHVNSRGVYYTTANNTLTNKELTSYDYSAVGWGATASSAWYEVITRDFVAGEYVWTGFDYLGEPTPANGTGSGAVGSWPSPKNSFFGIIDTAGLPKDNYYFYQSQWNDDVTTLHVLPAWNEDVVYKTGSGVPVVVYSDAKSVKLEFVAEDGTVTDLGTRTFTEKTTAAGYTYQIYEGTGKESQTHRNLYLTWYVPYEDGTIRATAYDAAGNEITDTVGRSYVTTTGDEAKLNATVDRDTIAADGKDLAYITVDVTDAEGNIVPDADDQVTFKVEGDGVLVGVDNGKQADHQSFQDDNRAAYNGSLIAIVQSTKEAGEIKVTATAAGLTSDTVTITTESTGETAEVGFFMSKNYYVQVGKKPVLPETIETRMPDGTSEELPVVWNEIPEESYAQAGTFSVGGTVDGKYSVAVTVNMIDELGGLLNYSTTTTKGVEPSLPGARPAVLVDGTILEATFPVTWEETAADDFAEEGIVVVSGTANVFGTELDVTASVRVQEETKQIGENFAPMALTLTQDVEADLQSDTLEAIIDGSATLDGNPDGGPNESAWSNYDNSQAGDNTAEIVFEYATQQSLGEVVIHFWRDGYSAEYPDAGTTEIYVSEEGATWTKLETTETMGEENGSVKAYTYSFNPTVATFVKLVLTNSSAQKTAAACTGIVEVELNASVGGGMTVNSSAAIAEMTVDGAAVSADELAAKEYWTLEENPKVAATGEGNAAVTVLPPYEGKVLVIVESEDHIVRDTFTIFVGQERPVDPSDSRNDVPVDSMEAISESQYLPGTSNEGPDDFILDGDANTHWHTNWQTTEGTNVAKRWVGVSLNEATLIDGIRYLPRTNGSNGAVTEYKIQYRATDDGEWIDVASGTWDRSDSEWKLVKFDAVTAKQVRVVGVSTWADSGNNAHMSTAEFRVLKASGTTPPVVEVDKTELEAVIEAAEKLNAEDYVDFAAVEEALADAKDVAADDAATQAEVDAAANALNDAIDALEEKPAVPEKEEVIRISGTTRYETGYEVADEYKAALGVDKFDAVVVATGKNFADALSGSYLAVVKNAPILLTNGKDDNVATLHDYIKANVTAGGKVYILGGEAAVPASVAAIEGYDVVRLSGPTRYDTNLAILEEAGITGDELIVATGKNFADSLSASAVKLPILLVKPGAALSDGQKAIADAMNTIYIVGGEGAVDAAIAEELAAYATVERVYGATRQETSVAIAEKFLPNAETVVVASAKNFPDGLCGGPLAAALDAPLLLTTDGKTEAAADYTAANAIASGYVLGGEGALADESVVDVFALESADEIVVK